MKVIGYIRVSTEEQANEGISLGAQRDKLLKYAAAHDVEIVGILEDAGVSAKSVDRPGLSAALDALRTGRAAGLLVPKLDRLSRSIGDWDTLVREFFGEKADKRLLSVADAVDTRSAMGRFMLNIQMAIAQWERETIAERTRDALQHKIEKGERVGRVRYGYKLTPEGSLLEDPREQAGIARMQELRSFGMPYREIGKTLGQEDFATKDGKPWAAATIRQILGRTKQP